MKKNMKPMLIVLLLMTGSLKMTAQSWGSTNLSTGGYDPVNAIRLYWPNDDPNWTVKTPLSGYQPVKIGTGRLPEFNADYQIINSAAGWLTPFPYSQAEADAQNALAGYPNPQNVSNPSFYQGGDIKPQQAGWDGQYIYRMKFNVSFPLCQKPTQLYLDITTLTGLGSVDKVYLNGHFLGSLSTFTTNLMPYYKTYKDPSYLPENADVSAFEHSQCSCTNPVSLPSGYTIYNLNPQFLVNGINYIYFTSTRIADPWQASSGFMCEGSLHYYFDSDHPVINTKGTSFLNCLNPEIKIKIDNLTSSIPTYTVNIYDMANPTVSISTSTLAVNQQLTVPVSPTVTTTYKIVAVKNGASCGASTATKFISIYSCNVSPAAPNPNPPQTSNRYHFAATPDDPSQLALPGFEYQWRLEELDPVTYEPKYTIDNPSCWQTENGVCTFDGFDPANAYEGRVENFSCGEDPNNIQAGAFFADRMYRITRSYKSDGTDWESYSFILGDEVVEHPDEDEVSMVTRPSASKDNVAGNSQHMGSVKNAAASSEMLFVYPNPGNNLFHVAIPNESNKNIRVYDMLGHLVFGKSTTEQLTEINLSNQPQGIYLLQVTYDNMTRTGRIVKQ